MNIETEIWKPIIGYEGCYDVSSFGRVKSLKRVFIRSDGLPLSIKERILKPVKTPKGSYKAVTLSKFGNKSRTKTIYRLVASAFIHKGEGKKEVNHIDGNKMNDNASNLEWVTHSENILHAYRTGLIDKSLKRGEKNGRAKLKEEDVIHIRSQSNLKNISSLHDMAYKYKVSCTLIRKILRKDLWKHLP